MCVLALNAIGASGKIRIQDLGSTFCSHSSTQAKSIYLTSKFLLRKLCSFRDFPHFHRPIIFFYSKLLVHAMDAMDSKCNGLRSYCAKELVNPTDFSVISFKRVAPC